MSLTSLDLIAYSRTFACIFLMRNAALEISITFHPIFSVILPFLRVSSPFDSLDLGLTPVRATSSYSNEGLVAVTISPCAVNVIGYQL